MIFILTASFFSNDHCQYLTTYIHELKDLRYKSWDARAFYINTHLNDEKENIIYNLLRKVDVVYI